MAKQRTVLCDRCQKNFVQKWVPRNKGWSQLNHLDYWLKEGESWNDFKIICHHCLKDWHDSEYALFHKLIAPNKKNIFRVYKSNGKFNMKIHV